MGLHEMQRCVSLHAQPPKAPRFLIHGTPWPPNLFYMAKATYGVPALIHPLDRPRFDSFCTLLDLSDALLWPLVLNTIRCMISRYHATTSPRRVPSARSGIDHRLPKRVEDSIPTFSRRYHTEHVIIVSNRCCCCWH